MRSWNNYVRSWMKIRDKKEPQQENFLKRKWSKITGMDEILIPLGSKGTKKTFLLEQWNKGL